jgi:hypothetical protein
MRVFGVKCPKVMYFTHWYKAKTCWLGGTSTFQVMRRTTDPAAHNFLTPRLVNSHTPTNKATRTVYEVTQSAIGCSKAPKSVTESYNNKLKKKKEKKRKKSTRPMFDMHLWNWLTDSSQYFIDSPRPLPIS